METTYSKKKPSMFTLKTPSKLSTLLSPRDEYRQVFDTNVFGVSLVTQSMTPLLRQLGQDKPKKIVNISSILGSITAMDGTRGSGQGPAYSVAKAALNMMTRLTANELRSQNFIVFAIHPGWVKTDLGGEHAPVHQEESVQGILDKLDHADASDSGRFFDYTGKELDW
jgi:NAD(P)-dependent dehydrogenase (short-subunit alcohol dehydrogenase family)